MYAGKMAKGFSAAKDKGLVFEGIYDKLPRFEIDDSTAELSEVYLSKLNQGEPVRLQSLLVHPELYTQYPVLSDLSVNAGHDEYNGAAYRVDRSDIQLHARNIAEAISDPGQRLVLMKSIVHEVQHGIQHIEGINLGRNAGYHYFDLMVERRKELGLRPSESHLIPAEIDKGLREDAFILYQRNPSEIEARDTEHRINLSLEQRKATPPYSAESIPLKDATPQEKSPFSPHLLKMQMRQIFHGVLHPAHPNNKHQVQYLAALYANGSNEKAHSYIVANQVEPTAKIELHEGQKISIAHHAISADQVETVKYFVDHAAFNPNAKHEGLSPIHFASSSAMVNVLADAGADMNAKRPYNYIQSVTALHVASDRNNLEMITSLINRGADVHAKDQFQNTPLHYAKTPDVAAALIQAGADPLARNKFDRVPQIITPGNPDSHHYLRLVADVPEQSIKTATELAKIAESKTTPTDAIYHIQQINHRSNLAPDHANSAILNRFSDMSKSGVQLAILRPVFDVATDQKHSSSSLLQYQNTNHLAIQIANKNTHSLSIEPDKKLSQSQSATLASVHSKLLSDLRQVDQTLDRYDTQSDIERANAVFHNTESVELREVEPEPPKPLPVQPLPSTKVIEEHPLKPETIVHPDFWTGAGGMTTLEQKEAGRGAHGFEANNNPNTNMPKPRLVTESPVDLNAPLQVQSGKSKLVVSPVILTPARSHKPEPKEPDWYGRPTPFGTEYDDH